MSLPGTPRTTGESFATEQLQKDPNVAFETVQRAAQEHGVLLQPIDFGRARRQLGLTGESSPAPSKGKTPRKGSPAFDWIVEALRADPAKSYGELKACADQEGHQIAPIMYGRAKALLGLVPVRPRGSGKKRADQTERAASAPTRTPPPATGHAQTSGQAETSGDFGKRLEQARSVEDLVDVVRELDAERRRLRSLLESIANSIDDALGYDD